MGYNTETVQELMSLVDDHKDDLKESTYLQICNAIMCLHRQQANHVVPQPVQYQSAPRPATPDTLFDQWEQDAEVQMERYWLQNARNQIRGFNDALETTVPGKIRLMDKYKVLTTYYGYTGPERNAEVTAFAQQLQRDRIMTVKRFKELSMAEKTSRFADRMDRILAKLNRAHENETEAIQRLAISINNRRAVFIESL